MNDEFLEIINFRRLSAVETKKRRVKLSLVERSQNLESSAQIFSWFRLRSTSEKRSSGDG